MGKRFRRRTLALGLLAVPIAAGAQSSSTPLDFLKSIYEPYKQAGFKGQPYWEARRFFVADLAEAIERDFQKAKKSQEVPALDGDPFLNAQDWNVHSINYAVTEMRSAQRAAGAVALDNLGVPTFLALFLVETPQGWRIDDIVSRGSSLRASYKLN
ncbi:MAG TPA: DUF3828 domain-containing protein [Reyranella sp.]|jgi:hypothetical protein